MDRSKKADQFERRDRRPNPLGAVAVLFFATVAGICGCETLSPHTITKNVSLRPDLRQDPPRHGNTEDQDCIEGGRLYKYYCGSCHNARPLGERPFSNYHVAVAHMRGQAYLTGEEYRQIIVFLRRWQDLGPATPPVPPSPKRLTFSQPIAELRKDSAGATAAPPAEGAGPFQPPAGAGAPALPELPPNAAPPGRRPDAELPAPIN
jgi:hypothetical protein